MANVVSRPVKRFLQQRSPMKGRARSFFLYVAMPAWLAPGVLDWWHHRRTRIEVPGNGGLPESAVHSLMFAEAGLPLVLGASFEMNPLVISLMTGSAVVHELTAMADVRMALSSNRHVSQAEQHVHSFLEVMPFWVVPLMVLLHEPVTSGWALKRRRSALSRRDRWIVAAGVGIAGVAPFAEELIRCIRSLRQSGGLSALRGGDASRGDEGHSPPMARQPRIRRRGRRAVRCRRFPGTCRPSSGHDRGGPVTTKVRRNNWTETPDPDDYRAASDYLSLLLPAETVNVAVQRLRGAPMMVRRAKDLLRASGLSTLPEDNPTVAKKLKQLKSGKLLSPVLCLRGNLYAGSTLTIADGYHRICASYLLDEGADIPCRLAELPLEHETLAVAVHSHDRHDGSQSVVASPPG